MKIPKHTKKYKSSLEWTACLPKNPQKKQQIITIQKSFGVVRTEIAIPQFDILTYPSFFHPVATKNFLHEQSEF